MSAQVSVRLESKAKKGGFKWLNVFTAVSTVQRAYLVSKAQQKPMLLMAEEIVPATGLATKRMR